MGNKEARLRCMVRPDDPTRMGQWNLNDEDRAAIQWAFDRIKTLEEDLERSRSEQIKILKDSNAILEKWKRASQILRELIA